MSERGLISTWINEVLYGIKCIRNMDSVTLSCYCIIEAVIAVASYMESCLITLPKSDTQGNNTFCVMAT